MSVSRPDRGDGPNDNARDKTLRALVDRFYDLNDAEAEVNKPGSGNFDLRMLQEDSRSVVLWAVLRPFLKIYAAAFPAGKTSLPEADVDASISVMLDEGVFFLTTELLKRHLRGEEPLGLARLAEFRYKRGTAMWEKFQQNLAHGIFDHARDLQLWDVEIFFRHDTISSYKIAAGQALIDFNEFVYQPKRREQLRRFYEEFRKHFEENDNA